MTTPIGIQRKLVYPLTYAESLETETPNVPNVGDIVLNWSTTDNDERIPVVLELSLNEYIALASAIDVGMDIAYGANAIYIWWIWIRAMTNFCETMINCINETPALQDLIASYSNSGVTAQLSDAVILDYLPHLIALTLR